MFFFYVFAVITYPFVYVAAFFCGLFNFIVDQFTKEDCYRPSISEWMHIGRKRYLSFRKFVSKLSCEDLAERYEALQFDKARYDSEAKEFIDIIYPIKWFDVYSKTLNYELDKAR